MSTEQLPLAPSILISNPSQMSFQQQQQQQGPASPNAQLYQKLLKLISSSSSYSEQINSQMSTLLANPNIKAQLKQLHSQLLKNPNQYLPQLESILLDKEVPQPMPQPQPLPSVHDHGTADLASTNRTQHKKSQQQQQSFENYTTSSHLNSNINSVNSNINKNVYLSASDIQHHCPQDLLDLREYYAKDDAKRFVTVNSSISKSQPILNHSQTRNPSREFTKQ